MKNPRDSLFRKEVTEARKRRLQGEVILKQSASARWIIICLVLVSTAAALWIATGDYARTEQALGLLETTRPSAKVMITRPGIVAELDVAEGDLVSKGDRLALIDVDRKNETGFAAAAVSLDNIEKRVDLAKTQSQIARNMAFGEKTRLKSRSVSIDEQISDLDVQIDIQKDIVESNRSLMEKIDGPVERGFITKVNYEQRRQNMLNSRQALSRLEQQLASLKAESSDTMAQLSRVTLDTERELSDIDNSIQSLGQQRAQLQGEKSYLLNAPIDGFVTAVQTSKGRTATGAFPLMTIIPENTDLQASIFAPTRAIGFVKLGQEVRLLYDAFPYQRFGSFSGKVTEISRVVIDPRQTDIPLELDEPVYRVRVSLDSQNIAGYGEHVPLQAGMTLTANIVLERQSFLDWILAPLRAVLERI